MRTGGAGWSDVAGAVDPTKFVSSVAPEMKGLGGGAGLGGLGGAAAGLGKARLVGAMSVPPNWEGSSPSRMVSAAMSGMGGEMPGAAGRPGRPWARHADDADADGHGRAGAGMPGGMLGRGGASPNHVVQSRPSVVPRIGVG